MLDRDVKLANMVAFLVLMDVDVMDKSPDYIREKFARYCMSDDRAEWKWGLDQSKEFAVVQYLRRWNLEETINSD